MEDTRLINEKSPNPVGYWGGKPKDPKCVEWKTFQPWQKTEEENWKGSSRREVKDFFARLVVVVVDLVGRPRFFVEAIVSLAIGRVVYLVIGEAVSTETDVAVGFSGLSLW